MRVVMKIRKNVLLKSFTILACLSASIPLGSLTAVASDPQVTADAAPIVSPLKHHVGILEKSTDLAELKASVQGVMEYLMKNPLDDLTAGTEDALNAAVHVTTLNELDDNGEFLDTNRLFTSHFSNFVALLGSDTPSESAAAYYSWLAGVVYTTETLSGCNLNLSELKEGFLPYLRRQTLPSWLIASAKKTDLSSLALQASETRKSANLAYRSAQLERLKTELKSRQAVSVLNGQIIFRNGTAVPNGQCGWHSAFDHMTSNVALSQLFGLVDDGTIYEPTYYEVVLRRLRDVMGATKLTSSILNNSEFSKENADNIAKLAPILKKLEGRLSADLGFHDDTSPMPQHLRSEPTEVEAKKAWAAEFESWVKSNQDAFNPWRAERDKTIATYEQDKWNAIFNVIGKFKFSADTLKKFILSDFSTIFPEGQLDIGNGENNYLRILQRLNLVNINVWIPGTEGAELRLIKQSRVNEGYRVANVLLQPALPSQVGVVDGHFDPLILNELQLAKNNRHVHLIDHLRQLNEEMVKQAAAKSIATPVPSVVVTEPAADEAESSADEPGSESSDGEA
jgi:hypothetical protein